jgi:hypothetical protein
MNEKLLAHLTAKHNARTGERTGEVVVEPAAVEVPAVLEVPEVPEPDPAAPVVEPAAVTIAATQSFFSKIAEPLIERNIPVIPLRPKAKIPFLEGWQEQASTDPVQIAEWAQQYPDSNCAAVALAQPGGVWFWESDKPEVLQQYTADTGLEPPQTFSVRSRPGRVHFYFRHNAASIALGNIAQSFVAGEGFSVRCDREYVVAASALQGSLHPITGQPYEVVSDAPIIEAPEVLIKWLIAQKTSSQTPKTQQPGQPITAGSRNGALTSLAGAMRNKGFDGDTIEMALQSHNLKYCQPPMDASEVHTIAWSVSRYDPTPVKPVMQNGVDISRPATELEPAAAEKSQEEVRDDIEVEQSARLVAEAEQKAATAARLASRADEWAAAGKLPGDARTVEFARLTTLDSEEKAAANPTLKAPVIEAPFALQQVPPSSWDCSAGGRPDRRMATAWRNLHHRRAVGIKQIYVDDGFARLPTARS